ncbi:MAG TPA: DUF4097 family beta strand repeat-containing protein [Thermoanaerobaculia bacterium]|nr:DUF4097 family beta strand repeat-containing protein [Thermoanaerobaculia bacterium]
MSSGRLSLTMNINRIFGRDADESTSARADRVAVWILLAIGLLLMLISASEARGENGSASRTDRFNGALASGKSLSVENIFGDVVASPGPSFSAVVTITVTGPTQKLADETLSKTKILSEQDDDGWSLETHWPGANHGGGRHRGDTCGQCRVVARYELVIPPGVSAELKTVNGDVRVHDVDGELQLESVNGSIEARGVRRDFGAQTVNGGIQATASAAASGQSLELQSVNGTIALTLPKDAKFEFSASTMNGTISSSFPLPPRGGDEAARSGRAEKHGKRIVHDEGGEVTDVDVEDLQREIEQSMHAAQQEIDDEARTEGDRSGRRVEREIRVVNPMREYTGSVGKGGAEVHMSTLNGTVLLLASGTKESDAKPLVVQRRTFTVTVPEVRVNVPPVHVNVPPVHVYVPPVHVPPPAPPAPPGSPGTPAVPPEPPDYDGEVVRGDVGGDFLSTTAGGSYRIGQVSGRVRILTHSGEIRVASAGNGADLKSFGGDVVIGPVTGDLKISTGAGDIRGGAITGSVNADTAGGDIRFERIGGTLDAKTAGGDVIAPSVGGSVRATTAGGDIRVGVVSRDPKGGVVIHNGGGDVSLALPADCKAEVDLEVTGADDEDTMIRTDFPGLTVTRRPGTQRLTGPINGGGEKIIIRTSSGTIRLRKAAAAQ